MAVYRRQTFPALRPIYGWQATTLLVNYPLSVSQLGKLSLPSLRRWIKLVWCLLLRAKPSFSVVGLRLELDLVFCCWVGAHTYLYWYPLSLDIQVRTDYLGFVVKILHLERMAGVRDVTRRVWVCAVVLISAKRCRWSYTAPTSVTRPSRGTCTNAGPTCSYRSFSDRLMSTPMSDVDLGLYIAQNHGGIFTALSVLIIQK